MMMEKKAKIGRGALLILGAIYTLLGGIFVALGITLTALMWENETRMIGLIFGGIGSIFLILGILFLSLEIRRKKRADRLLASGRYVWGEVVDIVANFSVSINGRHPYVVVAQYVDGCGVRHIFRSPSLRMIRDPGMIGKKVKVYIQNDSYKHYYVDVDGILPKVVEH